MNDSNSLAHTKWNCKYHVSNAISLFTLFFFYAITTTDLFTDNKALSKSISLHFNPTTSPLRKPLNKRICIKHFHFNEAVSNMFKNFLACSGLKKSRLLRHC